MIKIELKLFATIARYMKDCPSPFLVEEGTTIRQVGAEFGIPESDMKLIFVNGIQRTLDHVLDDGDRLGIFPPVGGG